MSSPSERTGSFANVPGSPQRPSEPETLPPADPNATVAPAGVADESDENAATLPEAGERFSLPGYQILGKLGQGGMGVVYKARHLKLGRVVALKMVLHADHAEQSELTRFLTEAESIAQLHHANVVQLFESGQHNGLPYFTLEFVPGGSLADRLREHPLSPKDAAKLVEGIARGVQHAHEKGIIHRDLKPANVLLAEDGTPKVTDFGLARRVDAAGLTATGAVMGTPSYMAPEQAGGETKKVGAAVDVYALGAVLYECLTGRPPFRAATPLDTMLQVLSAEAVAVHTLQANVPRDLETICHKCLHKEPGKRYATAAALADDLGRLLNGEPIVARPVGAVERAVKWVRRNAVVSGLTAAVFLAMSVGLAASLWQMDRADREAIRAARKATEAANNLQLAQAETTRAETQRTRAEGLVYAGKLSLAQSAFNDGKGAVALRHLEECQWDLRGWEHHHLWTRFNSKQTLTGHTRSVLDVAWSPDGRRVISASDDKTAKVWDVERGTEILTIKGHTQRIQSVSWSPDGRHILTGSWDKTATVWDAERGNAIVTLKGHTSMVKGVAWSPDGRRILTGSAYQDKGSVPGEVKVWDADQGREVFSLKGHKNIVNGVAWSPDSRYIASASSDRTAKVWDAERRLAVLHLVGHADEVTSVAFSPDGRRILTGSQDGTAKVWDARTGQEALTLKGHASYVTGVAFSPDGQHILTGSSDGTAKVWAAERGQELFSLNGHAGEVHGVAWSPDGTRILTGSDNRNRANLPGEMKVWDARRGQELFPLKGHAGHVHGVAWSLDGQRILTASEDRTVKVWDAQLGQETLTLPGPTRHSLPELLSTA